MPHTSYYHGSSVLFKSFSLDALAASSGARFGAGVYLTEAFDTAAHYAKPRHGTAAHYYVYAVEVPEKTEDNCLPFYGVPVPRGIIERVEQKLGENVPEFIKGSGRDADGNGLSLGKCLRKYIAHRLAGVAKERLTSEAQIDKKTSLAAELKASEFLLSVGVLYMEWPQGAWANYPNCRKNVAALDPSIVKVVKIEEVDLDAKAKYIDGTRRVVSMD